MEDNKKDYLIEYDTFVDTFKNQQVSGEEVGVLIMRMTNHFAKINLQLAEALRAYSSCVATFQNSKDENTGKQLSAAKAESLAAATVEAGAYNTLKAHVQNLEQIINSLKALQKGIMFEYSSAI